MKIFTISCVFLYFENVNFQICRYPIFQILGPRKICKIKFLVKYGHFTIPIQVVLDMALTMPWINSITENNVQVQNSAIYIYIYIYIQKFIFFLKHASLYMTAGTSCTCAWKVKKMPHHHWLALIDRNTKWLRSFLICA